MKTRRVILILAGLAAGANLMAADPPVGAPTNPPTAAPEAGLAPALTATNAPAGTNAAASTDAALAATETLATNAPPKILVETNSDGLRFNFRGAPLNLVLEHLVKAAGFILEKNTPEIRGTVEIWSQGLVSKDEAIELVGTALRNNGYAFSRNGRILTVASLDGINHTDLPLHSGTKWEDIPQNDEVVIWLLPVKYANASQLLQNLQVLLPTSATVTVNESANSIIIVGSQRDIRRMARLVTALDSSISGVTSLKVFPLHYADAKQLATEIQTLFSQQAGGGGGGGGGARQFFQMFGGGGRGGGGPFGGGGGNNGGGSNPAAGSKVSATSDDYSNSLIVSAAEELLSTIEGMVKEIDVPTTDVTELRVFKLVHADPTEMAEQLGQLFPDTSRTSQGGGMGGPGGFGMFRFNGGGGMGGNRATTSDRQKQRTQVMSVPDARTSSLLVSAASELMPHIAEMIEKLDAIDARHEIVSFYELKNADPQDVQQAIADLFNRNTTMKSSSSNQRSLLGQNNPLTQRATQTQNNQNSQNGLNMFGGSGGR